MESAPSVEPALIWPDDPSFRNFPKTLPDDCVEYTIYMLDNTLNNVTLRSRLLALQRAAEKLRKSSLRGYIWQRESFELSISGGARPQYVAEASNELALPHIKDSGTDVGDVEVPSDAQHAEQEAQASEKFLEQDQTPLHLHGRTSIGDSIADEWLIVYLLRTLSQQHPDAWIQIWDSDGQFLLMEAANALPDWLEPAIAENRAWIHGGRLVIIPPSMNMHSTASKKKSTKPLQLREALSYLRKHATNSEDPTYVLLDDDKINTEAFSRIKSHPSSIVTNLHSTVARIPRKLAYLLHRQPQWASPAIEAFYLRDPIAMRSLQSECTLRLAPEDMVDAPAKMQRVGFAQLVGQDYETPKAWAEHRSKHTNSSIDTQDDIDAATNVRRRNVGMKLTCGFEMLLADPANKDKHLVRAINLLLEDLDAGEEELPTDAEILSWRSEDPEDSESWLDIDWTSFEKELKEQTSTNGTFTSNARNGEKAEVTIDEGFGDKATQENLRRMVARFQGYLRTEEENKSGLANSHKTNGKAAAKLNDDNELGEDVDDEDDEDDDASFAPSTDSESEYGSSEEEGWGSDEDDEDENQNEKNNRDETNDHNEYLNTTNDVAHDHDANEPTDAELHSIISEMQAMGIKPPPAASSTKENEELCAALIALSDFKPLPAMTSTAKATGKTKAKGHARAKSAAVPAADVLSPRRGKSKSVSQAQVPDSSNGKGKGKQWAEDDDAAEIEEIKREMNDEIELSSDSDDDHLDPADVKSFEEMFGRELREAGIIE